MLSQFDSEGNHYQLFTEVTYYKKYNSAISKVDGFIKSSSRNLHRKRKIAAGNSYWNGITAQLIGFH